MSSLRHKGIGIVLIVACVAAYGSPAWASRQAHVPPLGRFLSLFPPDAHPDPACRNFVGPVLVLCNAFCKQQNCDVRPTSVTCEILKKQYEILTRRTSFPCEGQVPTRTATGAPTETPTEAPEGTATATATHTLAVPTGTVSATATEAPPATETEGPGETATPTSTPTETLAVPTGTASTVTPTDTPGGAATATHTVTPPTNTVPPSTNTVPPSATPTQPPATGTQTTIPSTPTSTPTATETPGPVECPIEPGVYSLTQTAGGFLAVDGLTPFPFPSGGAVVQHVYAAGSSDCVHDTVVPFPDGFNAPLFCIPGLNFSVRVTQTGCGIGQIDSDGGSDFTITEVGDTSSPTVCGMPASNCATPPGDSNVQVNVTVGGNGPDTCSSGTANAVVSIPVFTTTWSHAPLILCATVGPDPTGPGGPGDTTVVEFPQILDFTTDTTSADWSDLDPDGCCLAGAGPSSAQACAFGGGGPEGLGGTGTCIDFSGIGVAGADVTTVAAGTIGSGGSPLYDLTFSTSLPNELSGPSAEPSAVCATPPQIDFNGMTMRCINPAAAAVGGSAQRSHPKAPRAGTHRAARMTVAR